MDEEVQFKLMKERIEKFNNYVLSNDINDMPSGLFYGKMGIIIYFLHQARLTNDKKYQKFSLKLLDSIYNQLSTNSNIDLENGLIGVCLGINYLIEEGFLKGNVNYVLSDLDDKIYQSFIALLAIVNSNNANNIFRNILEYILYFTIRLKNKKLNKNLRYIYENLVIKAINQIEEMGHLLDKFSEPSSFSIYGYFIPNYLLILSKVYDLNFYNYKIVRILEEISDNVLSTYPLLQSSRLLLIAGMRSILKSNSLPKWKEHVQLLERKINIQNLINDEFNNKEIYIWNGISGLYLLLNSFFETDFIRGDELRIKIVSSDKWDLFLKNEYSLTSNSIGLVTGLSGAILAYQYTNIKLREIF
jgi:hypothetical protein